MGIIKGEDVIAWEDDNKIYCTKCGAPFQAKPLTEDNFAEDDVVNCDGCNERIL